LSEPAKYVSVITIDNQTKRNAMSRAMMAELAELWQQLAASTDCRCIVLTGAGEKAFCAGADIGGDLSASEETAALVNRALLKTTTYSKPIIAAINGDCAGGGVELLLSTDIRIAAEHARFGLPEVKWSIYPFGGATMKLVRIEMLQPALTVAAGRVDFTLHHIELPVDGRKPLLRFDEDQAVHSVGDMHRDRRRGAVINVEPGI
jgi:enoyl-CoA hydratase/carnithine racemase